MQTLNQRAILQKLARKRGQSPEQRERVKEFNEAAKDWRGRCRHCGEELEGSLEQLRGHRCGEPDTSDT